MTNNEITIKELKNPTKLQLDRISKLHILAFPGFFLTQLGYSFLKTLYTGYFEDEESGIIVAEKEEEIIGFIAYVLYIICQ